MSINSSIYSECESAHSETSTVMYDHEPFDTYQLRVSRLCQALWPATQDYLVERMVGGGFNRIIGIDTATTKVEQKNRLILRVPRFDVDAEHLDRQIATMCYVRQHTDIPIPELLHFDSTEDNWLERPYSIQKRLSGKNLLFDSVWRDLSHEQKCTFTAGFAGVLVKLRTLPSATGGLIVSDSDMCDEDFKVVPFDVDPEPESGEPNMEAVTQTTLDWFLFQFQRWETADLQLDSSNGLSSRLFDGLRDLATEMNELGYFNSGFSLCHLDLEPQNVIVDVGPDHISIDGILDWDSAVFAPTFLSCKPPMWLWAWGDNEEEDEDEANDVPADPQNRELKQIFEDIVGPDFLAHAFKPEYRFARKLAHLAMKGIRTNEDFDLAEELPREWKSIRARCSMGGARKKAKQTPVGAVRKWLSRSSLALRALVRHSVGRSG